MTIHDALTRTTMLNNRLDELYEKAALVRKSNELHRINRQIRLLHHESEKAEAEFARLCHVA